MTSGNGQQPARSAGSGPPQFTSAHSAALTAFLEAEAWQDDEKQIVFEPTDKFGTFLCCSVGAGRRYTRAPAAAAAAAGQISSKLCAFLLFPLDRQCYAMRAPTIHP